MDLLRFTPSELQHGGSSLKGTRDIWGGTELSSIRERTGGVAFSQTEVLAEAIVPLMRPSHTEPANSINLAHTACPTLVIL